MATWNDLVAFIRNNYVVDSEDDGIVKLIFKGNDMRSQLVLVGSASIAGEAWGQIASPFARVGSGRTDEILAAAGDYVVGGVVTIGDAVWVRHSFPLADLDAGDFQRPLAAVAAVADALEQQFGDGDTF